MDATATTTLERAIAEKKVEEKEIEEENEDDNADLLDVNLKMFSDEEEDSINEERKEADHPALYYTITLNWREDAGQLV